MSESQRDAERAQIMKLVAGVNSRLDLAGIYLRRMLPNAVGPQLDQEEKQIQASDRAAQDKSILDQIDNNEWSILKATIALNAVSRLQKTTKMKIARVADIGCHDAKSNRKSFGCSSSGYWHFHAARGNSIGWSVRI